MGADFGPHRDSREMMNSSTDYPNKKIGNETSNTHETIHSASIPNQEKASQSSVDDSNKISSNETVVLPKKQEQTVCTAVLGFETSNIETYVQHGCMNGDKKKQPVLV